MSNFTIDDFKRLPNISVVNGAVGVVVGAAEIGMLVFGVVSPAAAIPLGTPWGLYTSLGTLKLSLEAGVTHFVVTSVRMKGLLQKEMLVVN